MSLYVDIKRKVGEFTLEVQLETQNEVLGVLGASGSGKSMMLHCIAGVLTPTQGEIVLDGKTLYSSAKKINVTPQKRHIGLMQQSYALFPNMTVAQNIAAGIAKKGDIAQLLAEYSGLLRLEGLENHYPAQLSGGQQQRVALARMMAHSPDILMLDEPFSALDRHLRFTIEGEFAQVLERFKGTVLYVSHSMGEIYSYCNSALVLAGGKVVERGKTKELFKTPQTVEGARITGCKNLTRVVRVCGSPIAEGWNIPLPVGFSGTAQAVGVREGSISLQSYRDETCVPVQVLNIKEFPQFAALGLLPKGGAYTLTTTVGKSDAQEYKQSSDTGSLFLKIAPESFLPLNGAV